MPVLFSGSFNACVTAYGGVLAGCNEGSFQPNPVFGIFNVNGTGTANLSFINMGIPGSTIWRLFRGTYTLHPVSEPSGITLACVGAVGLILMLAGKHSARAGTVIAGGRLSYVRILRNPYAGTEYSRNYRGTYPHAGENKGTLG
jgi:hypothetical protein